MSASAEARDASGSGRPRNSGLGAVRLELRRRAVVKQARAERIATMRLAGLGHEDIRLRLGLSVGAYRRARRWLRVATARSLASPEPLTVHQALEEYAEEHVLTALRIIRLTLAGRRRGQIQQMLRLSDDAYQSAAEWARDAIAARR